jgi:hypothetical protein
LEMFRAPPMHQYTFPQLFWTHVLKIVHRFWKNEVFRDISWYIITKDSLIWISCLHIISSFPDLISPLISFPISFLM